MRRQMQFAVIAVSSVFIVSALGCASPKPSESNSKDSPRQVERTEVVDLAKTPDSTASSDFWDYWGDGKAELLTYDGKIRRYGKLRDVRHILIYVTEPMNRKNWIKDDSASDKNRVNVLKLNHLRRFQTGIYDYSVMTSLFSPVADWGGPRFQPVKLNMTSQDWCGQVYQGLWIGDRRYLSETRSYFKSEGDTRQIRQIERGTLFQNALWIQLRELDGSFEGGESRWSGQLVPRLWDARREHEPLSAVQAEITRSEASFEGRSVNRFRLTYGNTEVIYDVATEYPHRIVHWKHSNGSEIRLKDAIRRPYWKLNEPGGKKHRSEMGLPRTLLPEQSNPKD